MKILHDNQKTKKENSLCLWRKPNHHILKLLDVYVFIFIILFNIFVLSRLRFDLMLSNKAGRGRNVTDRYGGGGRVKMLRKKLNVPIICPFLYCIRCAHTI